MGHSVAAPPAPPPGRSPHRGIPALYVVVVTAAGLFGALARAWYIAHSSINSDEAVVGLMADQILGGHFYTFYWGQPYGGAEPYIVAVAFALLGRTATVLVAVPALLSAVAALLTWRVVLRLVTDHRTAAVAAALVWVAPEATLRTTTEESAFRGVTMIAGLTVLLLALRILDGRRGYAEMIGIGVAAGVGWWSSPEIGYFLVPAALVLLGAVLSPRCIRFWIPRLAAMAAAGVVGALPWIWTNANSRLASLSTHFDTAQRLTFGARLEIFFNQAGPIALGLKLRNSGETVFGTPGSPNWSRELMVLLVIAAAVVVVGSLAVTITRRGRGTAIAIGVVAFPFVYAASPATWWWEDGRYVVYLGPLLAMLLAVAVDAVPALLDRVVGLPGHRSNRSQIPAIGPGVIAAVVVGSAVLATVAMGRLNHPAPRGSTAGWATPDAGLLASIKELEDDGINHGYADYWVAYNVDFLSDGRLTFTPVGFKMRSAAIQTRAEKGKGQAWLFESSYPKPDGMGAAAFTDELRHLGIGYREVTAGDVRTAAGITAVIPDSPVDPSEISGPGTPG
jgi:hypothetical protein